MLQVGDVDKRQKLPVNENTNFNIILNQHNPSRERDAHFLISVKKSKKDRKGAWPGPKGWLLAWRPAAHRRGVDTRR